ncbi:DUF4097 family beta strand repeat-containing protein [Anaerocolumna sp. AGMB13020]|uniref:DUF4097 family beta strand repeat-containing protein n=1 Tax=Anaerocolumna sp. AGMB13020 TaxID=3081750 RepID=UPI00295376C6|nr:DUF4097 family beta strand repeat-containing protein [Anaerocolumna sp. AGMB13020]WOO37356.1 DUF4097 family beta strand repeat-containing protein [Anaerocolumna sp. AGMB13020]
MRVFLKNLLRIAGGAIAIGFILGVVAFSMDNQIYAKWSNVNFNLANGWFHWIDEDYEDSSDTSDYKIDAETKKYLIEAASIDNKDTTSGYPITYKDIKELEINMLAGKLQIREGDSFSIDVSENAENRIVSEVKDGKWIIREKSSTSGEAGTLSVFGVDIDLDDMERRTDAVEVYITLPEDFVARKIDLSVEAGLIKADMLAADTGRFSIGAGSIIIDELHMESKSTYEVAAGTLKIDDAAIHNVKIECTVGSVDIDGVITGESKISSSMGYIDLDLEGNKEDYDYSINCKLGSLSLNGERYSGVNTQITQKNKAANNMILSCDLGGIDMDID